MKELIEPLEILARSDIEIANPLVKKVFLFGKYNIISPQEIFAASVQKNIEHGQSDDRKVTEGIVHQIAPGKIPGSVIPVQLVYILNIDKDAEYRTISMLMLPYSITRAVLEQRSKGRKILFELHGRPDTFDARPFETVPMEDYLARIKIKGQSI